MSGARPATSRWASSGARAGSPVAARWLTAGAWAYLLLANVACFVIWTLSDRWGPATVLLFMGRWVLLLPLVLLLPATLLLRRRLPLAPLVLGAVIVIGPVMGFRMGWRPWTVTRDAPGDLRVVTINADEGWALAIDLARVVEEWHPDIVAIQECGPGLTEATAQMAGWFHHDSAGLCLLSRHPIRGVHVMSRHGLDATQEAGIGGSGDVLRYDIQTPRRLIHFTNLHLETARKGLEGLASLDFRRLPENTRLRSIESERARQWVDSGGGPLLVAGDFNMPVESTIYQDYWNDLDNAFSEAGTGFGTTKYNGWIRIRIDHVLMGPGWRAKRVAIGRSVGSDHRPLIVDLRWTGGR